MLKPDPEHIRDLLQSFSYRGRTIPEYMHAGIIRYLSEGVIPGDFLLAVLSNDLKESVLRADDANVEIVHVYARFLYQYAPIASWGSREIIRTWCALFARERLRAQAS